MFCARTHACALCIASSYRYLMVCTRMYAFLCILHDCVHFFVHFLVHLCARHSDGVLATHNGRRLPNQIGFAACVRSLFVCCCIVRPQLVIVIYRIVIVTFVFVSVYCFCCLGIFPPSHRLLLV